MKDSKNSDFAGWNMLSRVRQEIFGCSMIGIIIFHICRTLLDMKDKKAPGYKFSWIYDYLVSSTGVEIFIMLSGVGLCYSLHKNGNIKTFYKKRFFRLVLPYIIFALPFWIITDITLGGHGFGKVLEDFFFLSFYKKGNRTIWFVFFIASMYIIYPVLFKIFTYRKGLEKSRSERLRKSIIAAVIIILLYGIMLILKKKTPNAYRNTEIALLRIPVFIYGAYIGEKVYHKKMISLPDLLLPVIGIIMKMILVMDRADNKIDIERIFNSRLAAFFYSIALMMILALILDMLRAADKLKIFRKLLSITGKCSLELYMSHIMIRHIMIIKLKSKGFLNHLFIYIMLSLLLAGVMYFVSRFVEKAVVPAKRTDIKYDTKSDIKNGTTPGDKNILKNGENHE
ncbi:MAG: acyltransferase [Eubacterium sp.]|nr:acyltransferase [Eubacterium sp.]